MPTNFINKAAIFLGIATIASSVRTQENFDSNEPAQNSDMGMVNQPLYSRGVRHLHRAAEQLFDVQESSAKRDASVATNPPPTSPPVAPPVATKPPVRIFCQVECPILRIVNEFNYNNPTKMLVLTTLNGRYLVRNSGTFLFDVKQGPSGKLYCATIDKTAMTTKLGADLTNVLINTIAKKLDGDVCFVTQNYGTDAPVCTTPCP